MAMNGDVMAAAVIAAIGTLSEANKGVQLEVMKKMCGAIVSHITTNAVVTSTVALGIPVAVVPATGLGATTATGPASGGIL
jgi:hypothetical protein